MYEAFFGFTGKPFQLNPDPAFFFASRGHARAHAYLQYGLHQSEGFIVVTGEVGAGKTTLVRSLLNRLDPTRVVAAQLVTTQLDAEDLLTSVAAGFGVPAVGARKSEVLANVEAYLVSLAAQGRRALLVVDEAQNLTARAIEELRMLSNFQLENRSLLQSFLVGQPELRQIMRSPQIQQLSQRVIASYHLGPMDRKETQAYIEHRLKHVGWQGNPSFDGAAFDEIHASSGGIPRRINLLANRIMLAAYLGERHAISAGDVTSVARGNAAGARVRACSCDPRAGRTRGQAGESASRSARRGAPRLRRCPDEARRARRTSGATRLFDRERSCTGCSNASSVASPRAIADGKAARRAGPGPLRSGRAAQLHEDGTVARGVLARARAAACGAGAHRSALRPGSERPAIRRSSDCLHRT